MVPGPWLVMTRIGASQAKEGHSLPLETFIPWKMLDPMVLTNPHLAIHSTVSTGAALTLTTPASVSKPLSTLQMLTP